MRFPCGSSYRGRRESTLLYPEVVHYLWKSPGESGVIL
jgi:hypothetical protein